MDSEETEKYLTEQMKDLSEDVKKLGKFISENFPDYQKFPFIIVPAAIELLTELKAWREGRVGFDQNVPPLTLADALQRYEMMKLKLKLAEGELNVKDKLQGEKARVLHFVAENFGDLYDRGILEYDKMMLELLTELKNRRALERHAQAHAHLVQDEIRDATPEAIRAFNDVVKIMKENHPDAPQLLREPISTKYPGCDCGNPNCQYPGSLNCRNPL